MPVHEAMKVRPIAQPSREQVDEAERGDYDFIVARSQRLAMPEAGGQLADPYWGALLNAPPLARGLAEMGRLVRQGQLRGSYTDAQRELVDIVMSVDFGYHAILALHLPDALAVGVRPESIEALLSGDEEALDDEERLIAGYARAVVGGTVEEGIQASIDDLMGRRGALEFTIFITFLLNTMRLWQALGIADVPRDEIYAMLEALRSGREPLPHPARRIG